MVVAFMRLARKRSSPGSIVRSSVETWYHVGFTLHAAAVVLVLGSASAPLPCTAYSTCARDGSISPAKSLRKASSPSQKKPSFLTTPALAGGFGNVAASAPKSSPASGARAATYTSAETLGSLPASLIIVPAKECPTKTVGPSWDARARRVAATSSANEVNGFCTTVTFKPARCK